MVCFCFQKQRFAEGLEFQLDLAGFGPPGNIRVNLNLWQVGSATGENPLKEGRIQAQGAATQEQTLGLQILQFEKQARDPDFSYNLPVAIQKVEKQRKPWGVNMQKRVRENGKPLLPCQND